MLIKAFPDDTYLNCRLATHNLRLALYTFLRETSWFDRSAGHCWSRSRCSFAQAVYKQGRICEYSDSIFFIVQNMCQYYFFEDSPGIVPFQAFLGCVTYIPFRTPI